MSWQIPGTWEKSTLADICLRIVDGSHNPPPGQPTGLPMLSAKNIQGGKVIFDDFRLISEEAFDLENKRTNISAGDVLLTIVGALGRTAIVSESHPQFSLQRSVAVLKPELVCSAYLRYLLESPVAQNFFLSNAKGTAQKGIYLKALGAMEVPIAPLAEQTRIAQKLDELLAQVDTLKARIDAIPALLKRFRQSVLTVAVSGRLTEEWRVASGNSELLARWQDIKLSELCVLVTSGSRGWADYYSDSGAIFIRSQDINTDDLDISDTAFVKLPESSEGKRTRVQAQDILITITGANVGKVARVKQTLPEAYVSQHVALVRLQNSKCSPFIELYLKDIGSGRGELTELAYGGGKPGLNLSNIRDLVFALPPLDEQTEIVRRVEQLFAFADQLEAKVSTAQARIDRLTQSILAKAFSGELVPQDPNDEPASVLLERIRAQRTAAPKAKQKKTANKSK